MRSVKREVMSMCLNDKQKTADEALEWLSNNGPRATGRTFACAVDLIRRAAQQPGTSVYGRDHWLGSPPMYSAERLIRMVESILSEFPKELYGLRNAHENVCLRFKEPSNFADDKRKWARDQVAALRGEIDAAMAPRLAEERHSKESQHE